MSCDAILFELFKSAYQVIVALLIAYLTYYIIVTPAWTAQEDYKSNNTVIDNAKLKLNEIKTSVTDLSQQGDYRTVASNINILVGDLGRIIRENLKPLHSDLVDQLNVNLTNIENRIQPNVIGTQPGESGRIEIDNIVEAVDFIKMECADMNDNLDKWMARGVRFPGARELLLRIFQDIRVEFKKEDSRK